MNVEHLLDVFTTIDADSDHVWNACVNFMKHLYWHKEQLVAPKPKIDGLPDDHRFKPECLFQLLQLCDSVGNRAECKRLLTHALKLWRERRSDYQVAKTLMGLSEANSLIDLHEEGIQQAQEALRIYERFGDMRRQADCLICLAFLLRKDNQLDTAEEAAFRAIGLLPETGEQHRVCESHRILGGIYRSKGETEKAIHHSEVALGIASPFNWHDVLFWNHSNLTGLFRDEGKFDETQAHIEHAKLHTANSTFNLGRATEEQAGLWCMQHRPEEARTEVLRAVEIYDKLGATEDAERCRNLSQGIEKELSTLVTSGQSGSNCELLQAVLLLPCVDSSF